MLYKTNLQENLNRKTESIHKKYRAEVKVTLSSSERRKVYTRTEINSILKMKKKGYTDQAIADQICRTYWSTVYKIRELREKGQL